MLQNKSSNKKNGNLKELLQIAAKPFLFIMLLIMICAFFTHQLTGSETLEEYARNNPETEYGGTSETPGRTPADPPLDEMEPGSAPDTRNDTPESEAPDKPTAYNTSKDTVSAGQENISQASTSEPKESGDMSDSKSMDDMENIESDTARTTYQTGFYYEPLSDTVKDKITGISYPENGCTVPYEDLNYVGLLYIDFNGEEQAGELICNKAIAQDMVEIFYELYQNDYRIERIRLIDEYEGDDTLSMMDNNTSCFNYRVVDGTTNLSKHALGCAIDINPFYNPYVVFNKDGTGETYISPKGSEPYTDRSLDFPYKIDENDLCYKLFIEHGFTWGGNWNSCKDYQHFQIVL